MQRILLIFFIITGTCCCAVAQKAADSTVKTNTDNTRVADKKKFDPHKATIRSAIVPGWGQIYNKKYWKLPLVYGALGTTAGIFFYNIDTYKALKQAYIYKSDNDASNDILIDPRFANLSSSAIKSYRDSYRQNIDYSVLFFILFWGLNVVDATVDAHLKAFDVSDELSFKIKAGYSPLANTTGVSLVLELGRRGK
jgi:hypothetical protein